MAGIPDVRLHDLRHSFASDALMGGVPLAIIGKILGHRQPTTTQRYAHLSDRVVRDAIEQTSNRITDAAQPAQPTTPAPPPFKPLTNAQWAKVAPIVLPGRNQRSQPHLRQTLDGIRWVLHHNAAWQKVPKEYGTGTTCWRWHKRWQDDGVWIHLQPLITPPSARTTGSSRFNLLPRASPRRGAGHKIRVIPQS
jgi:transposase